jgi:hypothetical protein
VLRDLAVMLADGGDCLADLGVLRDQLSVFGAVASDSTAYGVIERIAAEFAYLDQSGEALAGMLRPGSAGSNDAGDHVIVGDRAPAQIPVEQIEGLEILVRVDSAGATHGLAWSCREGNMRFSVGYELTGPVREAILTVPADAWVQAIDHDGSQRPNGQLAEITEFVNLAPGRRGQG